MTKPMTKLYRFSPLWLGFLAALLFAPTLEYGFVNYDDPWLIEHNTALHQLTPARLQTVWFDLSPNTRAQLGREYLPLRDTSVMLDFALFGTWIGGHHLTNILLYGLLCGLLVLLLQWWLERPDLALATGLLFTVHPFHVEAVAWLSERKGLLAGCLIFLGMLAFYKYAKALKYRWLVLATLCMILGIWSKAIATMGVPFLAALLWLYPPAKDPTPQHTWRAWLGWGVLAVSCVVAFYPVWWVGQQAQMLTQTEGGNLLRMAMVHAMYLKLFFLGGEYGIAYPLGHHTFALWKVGFGAITAILFLGVAFLALWKPERWRLAGLSAWCWLIFLLPVSGLLFRLQNAMADRYMLLPSVGGALAVAGLMLHFIKNNEWLRWSAIGGLALVAMSLSLSQTQAWSSSEALYMQALRVSRTNTKARIQLAQLARQAGKWKRAWKWLQAPLRQQPHRPEVARIHALLLLHANKRDQAIKALKASVARHKDDKTRANLALLLRHKQPKEALKWAQEAANYRPQVPHNQRTLGVVALKNGLLKRALRAFQEALRFEPHNPQNHYNLAAIYQRLGQPALVAHHIARAKRLSKRKP